MKPTNLKSLAKSAAIRSIGVAAITALIAASAAANVLLPSMRLRNGLTDEQYEQLFAAGKHPSVDANTARDWMYRAFRYDNVVEWLDTIGKTNNFAALAAKFPAVQYELSVVSNVCIQLVSENKNLQNNRDNFAKLIVTKDEIIDDLTYRINSASANVMDAYADATNKAATAKLSTTKNLYNGIAEIYLSIYNRLNGKE